MADKAVVLPDAVKTAAGKDIALVGVDTPAEALEGLTAEVWKGKGSPVLSAFLAKGAKDAEPDKFAGTVELLRAVGHRADVTADEAKLLSGTVVAVLAASGVYNTQAELAAAMGVSNGAITQRKKIGQVVFHLGDPREWSTPLSPSSLSAIMSGKEGSEVPDILADTGRSVTQKQIDIAELHKVRLARELAKGTEPAAIAGEPQTAGDGTEAQEDGVPLESSAEGTVNGTVVHPPAPEVDLTVIGAKATFEHVERFIAACNYLAGVDDTRDVPHGAYTRADARRMVDAWGKVSADVISVADMPKPTPPKPVRTPRARARAGK